jgi:hypothetical protein
MPSRDKKRDKIASAVFPCSGTLMPIAPCSLEIDDQFERRRLEQQTATSEVLNVISNSLTAMLSRCLRL